MDRTLSLPLAFLFLGFVLVALVLPQFLLAKEEYPATCPPEAVAIVNSVGGCGAVNPNAFSAVYDKCCSTADAADDSSGTSTYLVYIAIAIVLLLGLVMFRKK
ncbi:MAG TPA: hypothetical protein VJH69_02275 [Candidatus Paceibacterota bacterium]